MATHETHRAQAKSLLKRGLISQKAHDRMMEKIEAMPMPAAVVAAAPNATTADPSMAGASAIPSAPAISATASVPGDPNASSSAVPAQQPPSA